MIACVFWMIIVRSVCVRVLLCIVCVCGEGTACYVCILAIYRRTLSQARPSGRCCVTCTPFRSCREKKDIVCQPSLVTRQLSDRRAPILYVRGNAVVHIHIWKRHCSVQGPPECLLHRHCSCSLSACTSAASSECDCSSACNRAAEVGSAEPPPGPPAVCWLAAPSWGPPAPAAGHGRELSDLLHSSPTFGRCLNVQQVFSTRKDLRGCQQDLQPGGPVGSERTQ